MEVMLHVNHNRHRVLVRPDEMLLDTLRRLGYKSVKRGCDTTTCGICSVAIDGQLVPSCSYLAVRAQGKHVLTVEGIPDEARRIAEVLTAEGVEQCGHCSPSLVMAIHTLLAENPHPTEEELHHYLAGNLCRCSGYEGQHRALRKYLEVK